MKLRNLLRATARGSLSLAVASLVMLGALSSTAGASALRAKLDSVADTATHCLSVGISTNYQWGSTSPNAPSDLRLLKSIGVHRVREDIFWQVVQPNSPNEWHWDAYDRLFTTFSNMQIDVLPIIGYGTTWASAPKTARDIPSTLVGQNAYAAYAAAVVARYGVHGTFWRSWPAGKYRSAITTVELWNEPWLAPSTPWVSDYVSLVSRAADAVHGVDPTVQTMINIDYRGTRDPQAGGRFWGDAVLQYADQLRGRIDLWALHPYAWPSGGVGADSSSIKQVKWAIALLQQHAMRGRIWITEVGSSTMDQPSNPSASPTLYQSFFAGLRRLSGPYAPAETYIFTAARPTGLTKPNSWDYGYNLIDRSGRPTPSLASVSANLCSTSTSTSNAGADTNTNTNTKRGVIVQGFVEGQELEAQGVDAKEEQAKGDQE